MANGKDWMDENEWMLCKFGFLSEEKSLYVESTHWEEWGEVEEEFGFVDWVVWGTLFSSFDKIYCVMSSCQERPAHTHDTRQQLKKATDAESERARGSQSILFLEKLFEIAWMMNGF